MKRFLNKVSSQSDGKIEKRIDRCLEKAVHSFLYKNMIELKTFYIFMKSQIPDGTDS